MKIRPSKLNFPFKLSIIKEEGSKLKLFDEVRKKWINYTPEEWVRQHTVAYFSTILNYPKTHMQIEKMITLYNTVKRLDVLISDNDLKPYILVECKAPNIKLTDAVFDQCVKYNLAVKAPYLFVTNGLEHRALKAENDRYTFVNQLPDYKLKE